MQRIYFYCPIADSRDDLVMEASSWDNDPYSSKLVEVTRSDLVLYVTERPMGINDDGYLLIVVPIEAQFYVDMSLKGSNEVIGFCTTLFPDHVKKHPLAYVVSEESEKFGIEIHFSIEDDV